MPYANIFFVRQLPFNVNASQILALFSKFGDIVQIRLGNAENTRGSAFIVFKEECPPVMEMNGYSYQGRYLIVRMHNK